MARGRAIFPCWSPQRCRRLTWLDSSQVLVRPLDPPGKALRAPTSSRYSPGSGERSDSINPDALCSIVDCEKDFTFLRILLTCEHRPDQFARSGDGCLTDGEIRGINDELQQTAVRQRMFDQITCVLAAAACEDRADRFSVAAKHRDEPPGHLIGGKVRETHREPCELASKFRCKAIVPESLRNSNACALCRSPSRDPFRVAVRRATNRPHRLQLDRLQQRRRRVSRCGAADIGHTCRNGAGTGSSGACASS